MKKIISFDQLPTAVDQLREKLDSIESLLLKNKRLLLNQLKNY